ncbi:hypothetical protein Patl1_04318 [Pistacia atlantica]|uniref:Uncharacterized protein n=1 Tax=Pistacia atlantica TaxID=434234 RepID=A0ACC1BWZ1_9ROSI|nr:hypothetical protein Patl1_04318 [Pistacia atlantica]
MWGFLGNPERSYKHGLIYLKDVRSVFTILDRKSELILIDLSSLIFKGLNITFEAGRPVALVGQSGSGKSSIIGLIERKRSPALRRSCTKLKNPAVLQLDFATSALDIVIYQRAHENMMVGRTCAAVAHRLSTNTEIRHHCCYQNWESCGTRFTQ